VVSKIKGWGSMLLLLALVMVPSHALPDSNAAQPAVSQDLDTLLARIEKRYGGAQFTADFFQESTLKAMNITDNARGHLYVKHPRQMRWEYTEPEPQIIVSDGQELWIYRPEDKQVLVGKAPEFFANGKGAGFLSDIKQLRKGFIISPLASSDPSVVMLKLVPRKKTVDLTEIRLGIDKDNLDIQQIITLNAYGDETRIQISNLRFHKHLDESLFQFSVPADAEVLQLE
jgi:outer membrane lipoprotein carrier protein